MIGAYGVALPVLVGSLPPAVDREDLICLTFTDLAAKRTQDREIARLSEVQAQQLRDLQASQDQLMRQPTHDGLTGLPNLALLVDRIEQALAASRRSGRRIAVFFIDLDGFKQVNDTRGHDTGDAVLRRIADRLSAAVRPMDTVARIGGDEFVVLTPDVDTHLHSMELGRRLVAELCRLPDGVDERERIAGSVGIAISVGGRGTAAILLTEADRAMYQAKSLGGDRAAVFDAALGRSNSGPAPSDCSNPPSISTGSSSTTSPSSTCSRSA